MEVRDRSTYTSGMETTGVQPPRLHNAATTGAQPTVTSAPGGDSSRLSGTAKALTQTMQLPDVREDRIASLRQQIDAGDYQIASQDVADSILRSVAG